MAGSPVHAAAPLTPEPGLGERAAEAGTSLIQGAQRLVSGGAPAPAPVRPPGSFFLADVFGEVKSNKVLIDGADGSDG